RGGDEVVVGVVGDAAVDGVAHDHGRLGRVEDDDGLAALGAADLLDGELGGLGELVDVGARAGSGGLGGDGRDDLGIPDRHDLRDGVDHGDGGLAAAGDHVVVGGIDVLAEVGGRDHHGADGRRGEVDGDDAGGLVPGRVLLVDVGASGLEQQVGLLAAGLDRVEQFVGTTGHADQSLVRGPLHPLGLRVDADHPPGLDVLAALELVHQVGTDVAGSHDRGGELGLLHHTCASRRLSTPPQSRVPFTGTATQGRYAGGLVR